MGSETTTTTNQSQSSVLDAISQLFADPAGAGERGFTGQGASSITGIQGVASGLGGLGEQLLPIIQNLTQQFQGLPSAGTALGFLQGGQNEEQRRLLDRIASRQTAGAEGLLDARNRSAFEQAGNISGGAGGAAGLGGGSFQGSPFASAAADALNQNAQVAGLRSQARAGAGQQQFQGAMSAQQSILGGLGNITGVAGQLAGAQVGAFGAAGDLAGKFAGLAQAERLATGRQTSSQTGFSSGQSTSVAQQDPGLFNNLLQGGIGAGLAFGSGGFFPAFGSSGFLSGLFGGGGGGGAAGSGGFTGLGGGSGNLFGGGLGAPPTI